MLAAGAAAGPSSCLASRAKHGHPTLCFSQHAPRVPSAERHCLPSGVPRGCAGCPTPPRKWLLRSRVHSTHRRRRAAGYGHRGTFARAVFGRTWVPLPPRPCASWRPGGCLRQDHLRPGRPARRMPPVRAGLCRLRPGWQGGCIAVWCRAPAPCKHAPARPKFWAPPGVHMLRCCYMAPHDGCRARARLASRPTGSLALWWPAALVGWPGAQSLQRRRCSRRCRRGWPGRWRLWSEARVAVGSRPMCRPRLPRLGARCSLGLQHRLSGEGAAGHYGALHAGSLFLCVCGGGAGRLPAPSLMNQRLASRAVGKGVGPLCMQSKQVSCARVSGD